MSEAGGRAPRLVGVISDTHGLLRPEAIDALRDCDLILHAGDIGGQRVLAELERLAPVVAVRGNCDGDWARALPATRTVEAGRLLLHVLHDLALLDFRPETAGVSVVISGHSHRPAVARQRGVLYLNPGSAGPRRPGAPVSLAQLRLEDGGAAAARIIELARP